MSIAGDHAHNDMAGGYDGENEEEYWDAEEPESEGNSWFEFFKHNSYTPVVPIVKNHPQGLLELEDVLKVWIDHTKNAEYLEDAYHSMYPEE
jgi:sirohydrochlorin cobaltochelatase